MKKIIILTLCFILLCGCSFPKQEQNDKLNVVTTIFPIYDFVNAVGGDLVNTTLLIKPGTEVHSFDPAPSDIISVYNCDLFAYIGGESDAWVNTLLADANISSISFLESLGEEHHHEHCSENEHCHHHHHRDEHLWTSPQKAISMINMIADKLSEIDSVNKSIYYNNASKYIEAVKQADNEIREIVNASENKFILVADRFPFSYFAEYYGINHEAAFDGCAVSTDISLKTMSVLVNTVKKHNVKAAFYIEMSTKNIANALKDETGVELLELQSGHNVSLDDFNNGITYVDLLKQNAKALERGIS